MIARKHPGNSMLPVALAVLPGAGVFSGQAMAAGEPDSDGDRLSDRREALRGTGPKSPDTDGDGLPDGPEIDFYGTNALSADTDKDGLRDGEDLDGLSDLFGEGGLN